MANHAHMQIGCLPSLRDRRTLRLANYSRPGLAPPPPKRLWSPPVKIWGVGGNDHYGNCVPVTAAHMILSFRANDANDTTPLPDEAIVKLSRQMGALHGYNILDRLKYWHKTGMWGITIEGYAAVDLEQETLTKNAIDEFGAADIALDLPNSWKYDDVWDIGRGPGYRPGTWGGHSVPLVDYDEETATCVTWGELKKITWPALYAYSPERWAVICSAWTGRDQKTPSGFDLDALRADIASLAT